MGKTLLFSPVGGTDPMPQTNWHDGSLVHICRVYRPDIVHLYMSAEILANHEADNRYLYCLEDLAKRQERLAEYHLIERPDLHKVQDFDIFYQDFRQLIHDISAKMEPEDTLLLNVSSGTPAMKSALLVLTTLGEYPCKLIQVRTPTGKMNEHQHEGYDVQLLWEGNEDNIEPFENRCEEIHCPSLSRLKQEEIIKKLVRSYDYEAALEVAKLLPGEATENYLPWLELACARIRLDLPRLNKLDKELMSDCIPIKGKDTEKQKIFEYALNLAVKLEKKEYADFVRGITPLIADLFESIVQHYLKINIRSCYRANSLKWDGARLQQKYPHIAKMLEENYNYCGGFRYDTVYSDHFKTIIVGTVKEAGGESDLVVLTERLRHVEETIRNEVAHEIVSVSDRDIKARTGFTADKILDLIKDAFKYTDIVLSPVHWDSYEKMNERIIAQID
ncbi:MAG: hypothetical protein IJ849_10420 [Selenomonadaceae bacterium]|nr:hypothetical protein [Selenomonadaceae bacterium]